MLYYLLSEFIVLKAFREIKKKIPYCSHLAQLRILLKNCKQEFPDETGVLKN